VYITGVDGGGVIVIDPLPLIGHPLASVDVNVIG
jgi:hypothetical protein